MTTLKFLLFALCICTVTVFAYPKAAPGANPAPKPTPVGLQYDEINRMVMPPGTPPPPAGSFQTDYAAIVNPEAAPGADEISPEDQAAMKAMGIKIPNMANFAGGGRLLRYAFYKGWIRVDDVVKRTAEIRKCDVHQFVQLNLDKKTYHISTEANSELNAMPASARGAAEQPGTAVFAITRKGTALGPQTIEAVATKGYKNVNTIKISQATGSCPNMSTMSMIQTEYISGIHEPRAFCPLPGRSPMGAAGNGMGCKPTFKSQTSGPNPAMDRLVMFSTMTSLPPGMDASSAPTMVMERGNVKVLYLPDATALFTIPADFTPDGDHANAE